MKTEIKQSQYGLNSETLLWCTGYELQVTGLGDRDEGVMSRVSAGYFSERKDICQQVLSMLQEEGLVMMRAPPRSGKTSLCQLVVLMARESSVFQQVFYVTCAAVNNDTSFSHQFHSMCGVTFEEAAQRASASNRTVIIVDEAQNL